MKRIHIVIILLVATITACQKSEEIELYTDFKPKLVSIVFIGAGEGFVVPTFQYTRPSFKDPNDSFELKLAPNIQAELSSNGVTTPIEFDPFGNEYQSFLTVPPVPGQSFTIKATDGNETVSGMTTIPNAVDIDVSVMLDSSMNQDGLFRYTANITYTLKGNEPAYIRIIPRLYYTNGESTIMNDESFTRIPKLSSGQSFTVPFRTIRPELTFIPDSIECTVLSCNEAYAKYYNSTLFNFFDLLPNAEPTIHYSNMTNKIGVIAAYNQSESKILKIK